MIRDYATAALGALALVVTLQSARATTRINVVQTPALFYLGAGLLIATILCAYFARTTLIMYLQNELFKQHREYGETANAARAVVNAPEENRQAADNELSRVLGIQRQALYFPRLANYGHRIVGSLLLVSLAALAISIVFKVST